MLPVSHCDDHACPGVGENPCFSFLLVGTQEWNRFIFLHIKFEDKRDAPIPTVGYLTSMVEMVPAVISEN